MTAEARLPSAAVVEDEEGVEDVAFDQEVIEDHYDLTAYGADFLVDGLINRINSGDIVIPTFDPDTEAASGIEGFQRRFVWSKTQCDRFIESLLLGLPVPEIFLVREPDNTFLVLDGQQRLRTLTAFRRGVLREREFTLQFAQEPFRGHTYQTLDPEDRRRLDNSIIHATILRPDAGVESLGAIYLIFERINSGGTPLLPHEIRIALNRGRLIELLRDLSKTTNWRRLYGPPSLRFKDQEIILRFFALLERGDKYTRPMKVFLNKFAEDYRNPSGQQLDELSQIFLKTTELIDSCIGDGAFRPVKALNVAVADSLMVGIARNLQAGTLVPQDEIRRRYNALINDPDYRAATDRSTADEDSVEERLSRATAAFESASK